MSSTRLVANCNGSGNLQVYDATVPAIAGTVTAGPDPRATSVNNGLVFVPKSLGGTATNTMTVVAAAATPPAVVTSMLGASTNEANREQNSVLAEERSEEVAAFLARRRLDTNITVGTVTQGTGLNNRPVAQATQPLFTRKGKPLTTASVV